MTKHPLTAPLSDLRRKGAQVYEIDTRYSYAIVCAGRTYYVREATLDGAVSALTNLAEELK